MAFWKKDKEKEIEQTVDPIQEITVEYEELEEFSNGMKQIVGEFNTKLKNYMDETGDKELRKFPFDTREAILGNPLVAVFNDEHKTVPTDVTNQHAHDEKVDLSNTAEFKFDGSVVDKEPAEKEINKGLVIYTLDDKHENSNMTDFAGRAIADEFAKRYTGSVQMNIPEEMIDGSFYDVLLVVNELKGELNAEIAKVMAKAQSVCVLPMNTRHTIDLTLLNVNHTLFTPFKNEAVENVNVYNKDNVDLFKMFIEKSTKITLDIAHLVKVQQINLFEVFEKGLRALEEIDGATTKMDMIEIPNILIHDNDPSVTLAIKNATLNYETTLVGEILENPLVKSMKAETIGDTNVEDYLKLLRSSNQIIHVASDSNMKANFMDPIFAFYAKSNVPMVPMLERKRLSEDYIENLIAITDENHVVTEERLNAHFAAPSLFDQLG